MQLGSRHSIGAGLIVIAVTAVFIHSEWQQGMQSSAFRRRERHAILWKNLSRIDSELRSRLSQDWAPDLNSSAGISEQMVNFPNWARLIEWQRAERRRDRVNVRIEALDDKEILVLLLGDRSVLRNPAQQRVLPIELGSQFDDDGDGFLEFGTPWGERYYVDANGVGVKTLFGDDYRLADLESMVGSQRHDLHLRIPIFRHAKGPLGH